MTVRCRPPADVVDPEERRAVHSWSQYNTLYRHPGKIELDMARKACLSPELGCDGLEGLLQKTRG